MSFAPNTPLGVVPSCSAHYADVLADLQGRLRSWMNDTDDPLLAGHVDPPPGVEINLPDQLSARDPTTRID